jgi:hypothetical protein
MQYRYTSFFSSKLSVCMQFTTSGKRVDTSLPTVMAAITAPGPHPANSNANTGPLRERQCAEEAASR